MLSTDSFATDRAVEDRPGSLDVIEGSRPLPPAVIVPVDRSNRSLRLALNHERNQLVGDCPSRLCTKPRDISKPPSSLLRTSSPICSIRLRSFSVHADRCFAKRRRLTDTSDLDSPSIETNISRKRISKYRRRYKRLLPLRINLPTIALHRLWAGHESHGLRDSSSTTRTIAATVLIAGRRMNCEAWHTLQTVPKR